MNNQTHAPIWGNKHAAAKILGRSPSTLKTWRRAGKLIEGIHWKAESRTSVLYHLPMCEAYVREDPKEHNQTITAYLEGSEKFRKALRKGEFSTAMPPDASSKNARHAAAESIRFPSVLRPY